MPKDSMSIGRRSVLKKGIATALIGSTVISSVTAEKEPSAVTLRGTRTDPVTSDQIKDAIEDDAPSTQASTAPDQLIQNLEENSGDLVAYNYFEKNGRTSVYKGRVGEQNPYIEFHGSEPLVSEIHVKANQRANNVMKGEIQAQRANPDWQVSDSTAEFTSWKGDAEYRTYNNKYDGNSDIRVVETRADVVGSSSYVPGDGDNQISTHDFGSYGNELEDWDPAGSSRSGSGSVSLTIPNPEISFTHQYSNEEAEAIDDSDIGEEIARAKFDHGEFSSWWAPDRIRGWNASLCVIDSQGSYVYGNTEYEGELTDGPHNQAIDLSNYLLR